MLQRFSCISFLFKPLCMDRKSFALVGENFHGFSFYFNFKVYNVEVQFFLQYRKLESIISEKTHLLKKHPKTDIGQMETVSAVKDIWSFMEVKYFHKINFFRWFTWRNLCNFYVYILQKLSQKWSKIMNKKAGIKKFKEWNVRFFLSPTTFSLGFLPWLKLDIQRCNGQRLTSVMQSTNKFQLTKCIFSYFFKFSIKCQMQCCIARNFSRKSLDEINVNVKKIPFTTYYRLWIGVAFKEF